MASWSGVVALSGFQYDGVTAYVTATPRVTHRPFRCIWATGTGWGSFEYQSNSKGGAHFGLQVLAGRLPVKSCEIAGAGSPSAVKVGGRKVRHTLENHGGHNLIILRERVVLQEGEKLWIENA
jgi:hypothetical protein